MIEQVFGMPSFIKGLNCSAKTTEPAISGESSPTRPRVQQILSPLGLSDFPIFYTVRHVPDHPRIYRKFVILVGCSEFSSRFCRPSFLSWLAHNRDRCLAMLSDSPHHLAFPGSGPACMLMETRRPGGSGHNGLVSELRCDDTSWCLFAVGKTFAAC